MKQMKRLLCGLWMISMVIIGIAIMPQTVQAKTASGNDGEIHWEIKGDTLTLSAVKGTNGRMKDDASNAPWFEYGEQIKNIVIQDKVTSLGALAFITCSHAEQVIIPKSVKEISAYTFILMFGGTSLKNVYGYTGSSAETFVKNYNDRVSDTRKMVDASGDEWRKNLADFSSFGFNKVSKYSDSPADVKVTFKSSNPKVAAVSSSGKVTGKKKGTSKISISMQIKNGAKKTVTTKVTVK